MARNIWDLSEILMSNRVGENIGAGIKQAGAAVADGMMRGQQIKERRTRTQKVLETMDPDGAKAGKYAEASLGDLEGALDGLAAHRIKDRDAREAESYRANQLLTAAKQRQIEQNTAAAAREYQALTAARAGGGGSAGMFPGIPSNFAGAATALKQGRPVPTESSGNRSRAAAYFDAGGMDPNMISALRTLEAQKPGFTLMTDKESGARLGIDSNGNASVISKPEKVNPPPSATKVDLGDGNYVYHLPGDKYLDKDMKPMLWAQPDAMSSLVTKSGEKSGDKPKDDSPKEVSTKEEFDALPKGTKFIFNGREGVKK